MEMLIRRPAVAGMFYPGSPSQLSRDVQALLQTVETGNVQRTTPKAIVAPHAGYIYSGPVAASIYARIANAAERIRRVVLLGPTHRVAVNGLALPASTHFATPLGNVEIDRDAAALLADLPQVQVADAPHLQEHSLEVQLPFLQTLLPQFKLLPLAVGHVSAASVAQVIERLWGGDETLIVVSSDLSHYLPYATAREIDQGTARRVLACDPHISHEEACGATPLNGLLLAARHHGLVGELVDLRSSGDTAGDRHRVVGYGGFAFYPEEAGRDTHVH